MVAPRTLAHGMGTFSKECDDPQRRWSKCRHDYKIRYCNASGRQTEESGFATQDKAIDGLAEIYRAKREHPQSQTKAGRIREYDV
ncbi:hypothetical protein ACFWP2_09840 [Kitasatospora sp. NPDC058444]|uniref:hypothetical protein n=1 Tax=Kitasatospora sp. NPDC058444 TaxID=3346504 RepID=UPI00365486D5